ncbi:MAG: bifunctional DNA primase/polymerase [Candidatus Nealsonbacteria bacterium]|nr:bifunctional DNA primase/polymerase [Candidatus Nealsonbacteria bacterium]
MCQVSRVDPESTPNPESRILEEEHGKLPKTVSARTGGGGRHLFFCCNGVEIRNRAKIGGESIDVRGAGGYIIVPPSRHSRSGAISISPRIQVFRKDSGTTGLSS